MKFSPTVQVGGTSHLNISLSLHCTLAFLVMCHCLQHMVIELYRTKPITTTWAVLIITSFQKNFFYQNSQNCHIHAKSVCRQSSITNNLQVFSRKFYKRYMYCKYLENANSSFSIVVKLQEIKPNDTALSTRFIFCISLLVFGN